MKKLIKDLQNGEMGSELFMIKSVSSATSSKGSIYLNITLQDISGSIEAKYWCASQDDVKKCEAGKVIKATYSINLYNEKKQMTIKTIDYNVNNVNLQEFIPTAGIDESVLKANIKSYIDMIKNETLHKIVLTLYKKYGVEFFQYPAATKNHHNYLNGLAQHTMEMAQLAINISSVLKEINLDLLLSGVLVHDLGKLIELSGPIATEYTIEGSLCGHISIMHAELVMTIHDLGLENKEESLLLRHMLLSHHNKLEFGSPVRPQILEAVILSQIDDMDAKYNTVINAVKDVEPGKFSEKIFALDNGKIYAPNM